MSNNWRHAVEHVARTRQLNRDNVKKLNDCVHYIYKSCNSMATYKNTGEEEEGLAREFPF